MTADEKEQCAGENIILSADRAEGTEYAISRWLRQKGEHVRQHEPILEIDSDKVTIEIPAPITGVISEQIKQAGEKIHVGEVLGHVRVESSVASREISRRTGFDEHRHSAAVRKLLAIHQLDAKSVVGSGAGGRITVEDVLLVARKNVEINPSRIIPHTPMRKSIARKMVDSIQVAPHSTGIVEVNMSAVERHRSTESVIFATKGVKLTPLAYFLLACVSGLKEVPEINSRWLSDGLEIFESVHIAIGIASEEGALVAPVIRHVEQLDLFSAAERLQDLRVRVVNGALISADLEGATFTISNHGVGGSLLALPIIITQPQCGALGIGKIEDRAVVVVSEQGKHLEIQPCVFVSLTIDHRAVDGSHADRFLSMVKNTIEHWK